MIAGDCERTSGCDHVHDEPQDARRIRTAVDQITDEDRAAPIGMFAHRATTALVRDIAKQIEQSLQLLAAAVDVADDVERPVVCAPVAPQTLAHDHCSRDAFLGMQHVHPTKAFALEAPQRLFQAPNMVMHHRTRDVAVLAALVAG
jgi:hypothetical protein